MNITTNKDVGFRFLHEGHDPEIVHGTVLVRPGEMVLEVECSEDPRPYTVVGKDHGAFYSGVHQGLPGDVPVSATWTKLDDGYVGKWVEEGDEWLFAFTLP